MIHAAVIGYGYWGPNLVRNLLQHQGFSLDAICDQNPARLQLAATHHPGIKLTTDAMQLMQNEHLNVIVIATPVSLHYSLAMAAIKHGKHVLLEKPMTSDYDQAIQLKTEAEKRNLVLMVDHVFLYNGVVRRIKELIEKDYFGDILYIDATRINLGIFQNDVNVLWDLATHDLSIVNYFLNEMPVSVSAIGKCHTANHIENLAYLTLNYSDQKIVHIQSSWTSPVKVRRMMIGGAKKMMIYDDIEPTEKLKVYDHGFLLPDGKDPDQMRVDYRTGDIFVPKYDTTEPLALMIKDLFNAITTGNSPVSDALSGLNIIKILTASNYSLRERGKEIFIKDVN
ncbi:MAG: Gfo/Idh/MocA family oxidoreductase [Bacteroidota bacterium]